MKSQDPFETTKHQLIFQKHQLELGQLAKKSKLKLAEATLTEIGLQDDDADVKEKVQNSSLCDLAVAENDIGSLRTDAWVNKTTN